MASVGTLSRQVIQQGKRKAQQKIPMTLPVVGAGLCLCTVLHSQSDQQQKHDIPSLSKSFLIALLGHHHDKPYFGEMLRNMSTTKATTTFCDGGLLEVETAFPNSFNESDRFFQVLAYHRALLPDYMNRWGDAQPPPPGHQSWPRKIPLAADIPALEMDYHFCKRSSLQQPNQERACRDLQFRIGVYYVTAFKDQNRDKQMIGYRMIKELAEQWGHPDAMCYYGEWD